MYTYYILIFFFGGGYIQSWAHFSLQSYKLKEKDYIPKVQEVNNNVVFYENDLFKQNTWSFYTQ